MGMNNVMSSYVFFWFVEVIFKGHGNITIFKSMRMFCRTDNIMQNIPYTQFEYGEYYAKYW